jgi:hypothetical protein
MRINHFVFLCLFFALAGCGRGLANMPKLYSVTLSIVMNNQPLDGALVACYPVDDGEWFAGGTTDTQGVVRLKTKGIHDGIAAGDYKVCVTKAENSPDATEERHKAVRIVHVRFETPETTPLTCKIENSTKNVVLNVEPAPPNEVIED